MAGEIPRFEHGEIGGLPAFWAESPLPFLAALVFHVGRADEPLHRAGITHLIEHLALPAHAPRAVEFNGVVDPTTTLFWTGGPVDGALELLAGTARTLHELPFARLENERSILLTEASSAGRAPVQTAATLRFGARGHGTIGIDELGLYWVGREQVEAWAAERFTAGNAALYLTAPPPDGWSVELPPGPPSPHVAAAPLPDVVFPSCSRGGPDGVVTAAVVGRRTSEFSLAASLAESRVRERLRYAAGITYGVDSWYEPLDPDVAHFVVWADCRDEHVDAARSGLLTALSDLADDGPTEEELELERAQFRRMLEDPGWTAAGLFGAATRCLEGKPFETPEELLAGRLAVTADQVAAAWREAFDSLLLLVPEHATAPAGRFTPYPEQSAPTVSGRRYRPRALRARLRRAATLTAGEEGVMVEAELRTTVRFAECQAVLHWEDGTRALWAADASHVVVDPADWRRGSEVTELIDRFAPADVRVPMDGTPLFADPALDAGMEAIDRGDWDEAARLLEEGLGRAPGDALGWAILALAALVCRRPGRALEAAERAVALDPERGLAHRVHARALLVHGLVPEAREALARARSLEPADADALGHYAGLAAEAGEPRKALSAAERATEIDPEGSDGWWGLGVALDAVGQAGQALEAAEKALALAPKDPSAENLVGWLRLRAGDAKGSLAFFRRARRLMPDDVELAGNAALAHALAGDEREAAAILRRLGERLLALADELAAEGDASGPVLLDRVVALRLLGRGDEALEVGRAALETAPHPDTLSLVVGAELAAGSCEAARAALAAAAAMLSHEPPLVRCRAWIAACCGGDADAATDAAARALELAPDDVHAHQAVAYAAVARGDDGAAERAFLRASELERPRDCCPQAWLGILQTRRGDAAAGRAARERARRINPVCEGACPNKRLLDEELAKAAASR
jgi:zinc protease